MCVCACVCCGWEVGTGPHTEHLYKPHGTGGFVREHESHILRATALTPAPPPPSSPPFPPSCSYTSMAHPASRPPSTTSIRAGVSISPPRLTLIRMALRFIMYSLRASACMRECIMIGCIGAVYGGKGFMWRGVPPALHRVHPAGGDGVERERLHDFAHREETGRPGLACHANAGQ